MRDLPRQRGHRVPVIQVPGSKYINHLSQVIDRVNSSVFVMKQVAAMKHRITLHSHAMVA